MLRDDVLYPKSMEHYRTNPRALPVFIADYSQWPGRCKNCGGTGLLGVVVVGAGPFTTPMGKVKWIDPPNPPLHPLQPTTPGWYEYELIIEYCPVCKGNAMKDYLFMRSGLTDTDRDKAITNFRCDTEATKGKREARNVIAALLSQGRRASGFVTLYGAYGRGKTHLLKALVLGMIEQHIEARYYLLSDLLAEIRKHFEDQNQGYRQAETYLAELQSLPVLAIDEFDKVKVTDWARETIHRLIDARYSAGRLTVIATNLTPAEIDEGYLASRLASGVLVEVGGEDMRLLQGALAEDRIREDV